MSREGGARLGVAGGECSWCRALPQALPVPAAQFLQFRTKIMNKQLDRFGNRVEFTGNPTKYDVSFTLNNVQLEDEGTYNCYVLNPPDRQRGHASISLKVLTKGRWGAVPSPGRHPRVLGWLPALPPALPLPLGCLGGLGLRGLTLLCLPRAPEA